MRCPYCGAFDNRVIDSRVARDGRAVRRRRHCDGCGERFTTYEVVEDAPADVEKRTGHTEPFAAEKLVQSLSLACKKRPVSSSALNAFVDRLRSRIAARPRKTITSAEIGEAVLAFLRELDPVAYVRYASVYRSFQTIAEFTRELDTFIVPDGDAALVGADAEAVDEGSEASAGEDALSALTGASSAELALLRAELAARASGGGEPSP